jgi:hypothetical protein
LFRLGCGATHNNRWWLFIAPGHHFCSSWRCAALAASMSPCVDDATLCLVIAFFAAALLALHNACRYDCSQVQGEACNIGETV